MTESTAKLQAYKTAEAFVQCDFIDGFKYVDKAGEILNLFVREKKAIPKFEMGLNGLIIKEPSADVSEVRISSNTVWLHYVEPRNLGSIASSASVNFENILKILKPTLFRRIGWRTYLLREVSVTKTEDIKKVLSISNQIKDYGFQSIVLSKPLSGFDGRIEVTPAKRIDDDTKNALLFDIDISKTIKVKPDIRKMMEEIRRQIRSDELLDGLEGLING